MWQFYQSETDPAVKAELLRLLSGNTEKLIEVARTEKDAKLRRAAIQSLGSVKATNTSDALVSIYGGEQDQQVKRTIINSLANQRSVQPLMQLYRKESDVEVKRTILRSITDMHSPEATQFLEDILK
jgi:HEAT repeat protein